MQRLLFSDLFLNASIALALIYYNEMYAVSHGMVQMSLSGFTGVTTAVGLLAGFRLNASYGRYEGCRHFWEVTINAARDLAMNTMMWMKDKDQQARMQADQGLPRLLQLPREPQGRTPQHPPGRHQQA